MAVYFTSDLHIGHKAICKYRTIFKNIEEHNTYMIDKILELNKRDILYIIGDSIFDCDNFEKYMEMLRAKKCRIKLIFGNHCSLKLLDYRDIFEIQLPLFSYKGMWVSHCPIHPHELRNRTGNIHGHLHSETVQMYAPDCFGGGELVQDTSYFNVNIEDNGYKFVKLETIKDYFAKQ